MRYDVQVRAANVAGAGWDPRLVEVDGPSGEAVVHGDVEWRLILNQRGSANDAMLRCANST